MPKGKPKKKKKERQLAKCKEYAIIKRKEESGVVLLLFMEDKSSFHCD